MSFDKEGGWPDRSEIARKVISTKDSTELCLYASIAMAMACAVAGSTMQESVDMWRRVSVDTEEMLMINWDKFRQLSNMKVAE